MGAWGAGNFENDDAMDWTYELEKAQDAALIVETLEIITKRDDEYLEAPDCCNALAAAEVAAALKNQAAPNLPETVKAWVSLRQTGVEPNLTDLALKAVERIRTNSELKELWDESNSKQEWYDVLSDLERRLRS